MQDFDETIKELPARLSRSPVVGDTLGPFRLERHLGRGGMGDVFVARGLADERVALKCIEHPSARAYYRFKREYRSVLEVHHPNLVSLDRFGVAGNIAYYTMELVDGQDFVSYVRAERDPRARLTRLLHATTQLMEAMAHLHELGCIHRDIKPANVLVTESGRVVLLDFGLLLNARQGDQRISHSLQVLGTPAYMAPEQADSNRCKPASDLYAVGVMLFELLYNRPPLLGDSNQQLAHKRNRSRIEIPEAPAYPAQLRRLVGDLLAPEPWQRPSDREVLEVLYSLRVGGEPSCELSLSSSQPIEIHPFVGRTRELDTLLQAHVNCVGRNQPVCVSVIGPDGAGKSSLLRRFAELVRERSDRALVLRGRCLESVSVPYRGVDEFVDSLSAFLHRSPARQVASLQPRHPAALARMFPVLAGLWPSELGFRHDSRDERDEGVLALREVLTRVADRWRLVIIIDDFHNADADGRQVLTELLRAPDAPALTLIIATREHDEPSSPSLPSLDAKAIEMRELVLEPLAKPDAHLLVDAVLTAGGTPTAVREALVSEVLTAGGATPRTLIQQAQELARRGPSALGSTQLIVTRLERLPPLARNMLEYLAVAGAALQPELLGDALTQAGLADAINLACAEGLLVRPNIREVDVSHGSVRAAILEQLDSEQRDTIHRRLAECLEQSSAAPELIIEHLRAAGRHDDALARAVHAADQAAESLAFARAIQLYRLSLTLIEPESPYARPLRMALAEQLANDGRGPEASRHYLDLATNCGDPGQARELRRHAALLLLTSGHVREGLGILRSVLHAIGHPLPPALLRTILGLAFERIRLALSWNHWRNNGPSTRVMSPKLREVVETLLVAVRGLELQHQRLAYQLQTRALRLALPYVPELPLAILLGAESLTELARGHYHRSQELQAQFDDISVADDFDTTELDLVDQGFQVVRDFLTFDFGAVVQNGPRVWVRCGQHPGSRWLRGLLSGPIALAWLYTGDFNSARRECQRWRIAAIERGNLQRVIELGSILAIISLYSGALGRAHALLDELEESLDDSFVSTSTLLAHTARALALSYAGDHDAAVSIARANLRRARRSGLLVARTIRCLLEDVVSRCELSRCIAASRSSSFMLRRRIERRIASLSNAEDVASRGLSEVLRASLASIDDNEDRAYHSWLNAQDAFRVCDFDAHLAAVRWRLSALRPGPDSEASRARAQQYFDIQGISDPERFVDLIAPAWFEAPQLATTG